ncbi:MAG: hypothetical protein IPL78_13725 [Chloroflexi bacterium]|nr:hypothetical protein [Chloroflexota bacterium]
MAMMMDQVSVKISRQVYERAAQWARKRKLDVGQVIEEAIEGIVLTDTQYEEDGWDQLMQAVNTYQSPTGISDLADEHDHYLYGKLKRNPDVE